ncbi:MAG: hypothetical protein DRP63_09725 [Planctomycetota bacterium]|nr:MAG: hypothetical protein DRP63_09725 [Planctomycetota bacterium]
MMRVGLIVCLFGFVGVGLLRAQQEGQFQVPWLKVGNERYPVYIPEKPYAGAAKRYVKPGPFRIHGAFSARFKYSDNIYYSPSTMEPISDTIFAPEIALRADLVRQNKYYLLVGLNARRNQYLSNSDLSNNEFLFNTDAKFWLGRNFDLGCLLNVSQEVEPISIEEVELIPVTYAVHYKRTRFNLLAFFDWKTPSEKVKMRLELQGKNVDLQGEKVETGEELESLSKLDHNDVYFNTLFSYSFSKKLSLTARLGGGSLTYTYTDSPLNDFSYKVFFAGARGELSPKTRYAGELGYYIQSVSATGSTKDDEYTGPVWRGSFEWYLTGKMLACLQVLRWVEYHCVDNYQVVDSFGGKLRWVMTKRIYLESGLRFELSTPAVQESANRVVANVSAYYRLKRILYLGAGVEYVSRSTDIQLASYDVTTVYFHTTIAF